MRRPLELFSGVSSSSRSSSEPSDRTCTWKRLRAWKIGQKPSPTPTSCLFAILQDLTSAQQFWWGGNSDLEYCKRGIRVVTFDLRWVWCILTYYIWFFSSHFFEQRRIWIRPKLSNNVVTALSHDVIVRSQWYELVDLHAKLLESEPLHVALLWLNHDNLMSN